jgi:hypothetical protein
MVAGREMVGVTQAISQMPTTSATQKWINPADPNVINRADTGKYVGKTKSKTVHLQKRKNDR